MRESSIRQMHIRWTALHHPGDSEREIDSVLEAGGDEGPLLALSLPLRRVGRRHSVYWIFDNVLDYKWHLASDESDLPVERWVGIATRIDEGLISKAVVQALAAAVAPAPSPRRLRSTSPFLREGAMVPVATLVEETLIRNSGEFYSEVRESYPSLRGLMVLQPAGLVDYGDDLNDIIDTP